METEIEDRDKGIRWREGERGDNREWGLLLLLLLGLKGGFEPPDLDRPGRLPHQQGLCEARLGCQDESPQLGAPVLVKLELEA